jgi:hypothetical protein
MGRFAGDLVTERKCGSAKVFSMPRQLKWSSRSPAGDDVNDDNNNLGQHATPIQRSVYMIRSESQFENFSKQRANVT